MALSKIQAESMNLADTYAFTGAVSGAGKMELISSDTTGVSDVAYADINLSQSTDYHHQILVINGYYHNTGTDMAWQMIEGGSPVTASASYYYEYIGRVNGVSTEGGSSMSDPSFRLNWYAVGNATGELVDIYIKLFNAPSSSARTTLHAEVNGFASSGNIFTNYANAIRASGAVCEGIRMKAGSGNVSYSNYALYGVTA